jgi:hypothetical protein
VDEGACIRVWVRDSVPERFRGLVPEDDGRSGVLVLFVAHVPAAVLAGPTYRRCNGASGVEGWMREGESGLFGANALDTYPHPDGDGILVVGSCV